MLSDKPGKPRRHNHKKPKRRRPIGREVRKLLRKQALLDQKKVSDRPPRPRVVVLTHDEYKAMRDSRKSDTQEKLSDRVTSTSSMPDPSPSRLASQKELGSKASMPVCSARTETIPYDQYKAMRDSDQVQKCDSSTTKL
ncbi:unnamed protein product [Microthlaspi erraticum]|uniref:Uncharacterized protein n=1 Tax=Microthlaspi erraticum TaxID=1685480 RepID=A0A6D2LCG6_9BRAS|nr:unnamed protein product [Microthlaspi erraticum]